MNSEEGINHARVSFAMLRWGALVALLVLPFTFSEGFASATLIASAFPIAIGWLASLVMAWRTRNQLWLVLSFFVLMVIPRFTGLHAPELPKSHAFQWLCYVLILAGSPLLLFRIRMLEVARLNTTTKPAQASE